MRKLTLALFTSLMLLFGLNIDIQGQTISSTAQRICVGDSVIIETYGVTVTGWSNGMSGNSIVVFPSTTTTYTATYWDAATQSNLQLQETIVVDALPDATISGNLSVCPGEIGRAHV